LSLEFRTLDDKFFKQWKTFLEMEKLELFNLAVLGDPRKYIFKL
jgi:hypothetical protein